MRYAVTAKTNLLFNVVSGPRECPCIRLSREVDIGSHATILRRIILTVKVRQGKGDIR
jgi:hypothetical protein